MIKDMSHYPEWLSKLVSPRQNPQTLFSNLGYSDIGDIFEIDHKDLKYLAKQSKRSRVRERIASRNHKKDFLVIIES